MARQARCSTTSSFRGARDAREPGTHNPSGWMALDVSFLVGIAH